MTLPGMSRPVSPVVLALVATLMAGPPAFAQSPAPTPPASADTSAPATPAPTTPPATTPAPAAPAPATTPPAPESSQAAPAAPAASPTTPAPAGTPPATPPAAEAPAGPPLKTEAAEPFGEEVTLTAKKVVTLKSKAVWDTAFETLTDSIKKLTKLLADQKLTAAGPVLIVYTSTDDAGFTFQAEIPVDQDPKNLPKDMVVTQSPEGKMLKFVHHGSYDNMDNTYEAITNYLDDKKLEARDMFIEEYVTDPLKVEEDQLVINVFVPLK
jgi:effector-binding domain-containing protein